MQFWVFEVSCYQLRELWREGAIEAGPLNSLVCIKREEVVLIEWSHTLSHESLVLSGVEIAVGYVSERERLLYLE